MSRDIKSIIQEMTLEEKAGMCSGEDFWHLKSVERLGIPRVMVSDGPHGLRKQDEAGDNLGINDSIEAVCFPAACATACSFDRELLRALGETIGNECQAENLSVILGPAVNIKRSPLCGRNFEYFSEDPYLAGQMAKSHIEGAQSQGIGTSIKHFAANNQEYRRMSCSSEVDEQALREIYLAAFETPIKEAKPKTVMCSYNKINGIYSSENTWLLTDVLRKEWGYEGYVMSDWGAVNDRVKGLKAGLELEMPSSNGIGDRAIVEAVKSGALEESVLDQAVERILKIIFDYTDNRKEAIWNKEKDHSLAVKIEEESAVLLKNEGILPIEKEKKAAFIGLFADQPRFQGGGSSHINAFKVTSALQTASSFTDIIYAQGYEAAEDKVDEALVRAAVDAATQADVAVIFAGLPDAFESEGYDRKHMSLPKCQNHLIEEVCKVQENTVVVLHNGSSVEMPWADSVKAILEMYLGGQGVGEAAVRLLYGDANPCGRLAETFPYQLEDNPSYLNFPGDGKKVFYQEGIFVGYRYYDKKNMAVRFPFGHGLSYTSFEYSDLKLDKDSMSDTETLTVSLKVKNTGCMAGKEVVQLYVSNQTGSSMRPVRELKNFEKIHLNPGEEKVVQMKLGKRSFAEYNEQLHDWYVPSGTFEIQIGRSSRDLVLCTSVELKSTVKLPLQVDSSTTIGELMENPNTSVLIADRVAVLERMFGGGDADAESDAKEAAYEGDNAEEEQAVTDEMGIQIRNQMPLREVMKMTGMNETEMKELLEKLNEAGKA